MVLCGTWSETSVAPSQLTQFWQIPRHRTLSYSLCTPFFVTLPPSGGTCKYNKSPSTKKKLWEILYLFICSFLLCLSWLLRSRVRKFRRDLWITLYLDDQFDDKEMRGTCRIGDLLGRDHTRESSVVLKSFFNEWFLNVAQNTEPVMNFCGHCHEPPNYMRDGEVFDSLSGYCNLKPNSATWSYGNTKSALPCYVTTTMRTGTLYRMGPGAN